MNGLLPFPDNAVTAPRYNERTANGLTRAIIDFLRQEDWHAERVSITGRYKAGKWIRASMMPGTADIHTVINGRAVMVEVKIGSDIQSEAQKHYQEEVEKAGGVYIITGSFSDFFNWYKKEKNCYG